MLRAAGARRLTGTFSRCPTGAIIARRNALSTWDVKHIGHSDPADLFGGRTPDRAFRNAQIHATIQITSESVLFLPLSFFTLGEYNLI